MHFAVSPWVRGLHLQLELPELAGIVSEYGELKVANRGELWHAIEVTDRGGVVEDGQGDDTRRRHLGGNQHDDGSPIILNRPGGVTLVLTHDNKDHFGFVARYEYDHHGKPWRLPDDYLHNVHITCLAPPPMPPYPPGRRPSGNGGVDTVPDGAYALGGHGDGSVSPASVTAFVLLPLLFGFYAAAFHPHIFTSGVGTTSAAARRRRGTMASTDEAAVSAEQMEPTAEAGDELAGGEGSMIPVDPNERTSQPAPAPPHKE